MDFQHASGRRATAQALVNEQTHSAVACRERKVTGGDAAVVITMVVTGKDDVDDDWDVSGKRMKKAVTYGAWLRNPAPVSTDGKHPIIYSWLVVWNIFYFSIYWE